MTTSKSVVANITNLIEFKESSLENRFEFQKKQSFPIGSLPFWPT